MICWWWLTTRGFTKLQRSFAISVSKRTPWKLISRLARVWNKDDPVDVAKVGFEAMMNGEGDAVSGLKNKVMTTVANVTPAGVLAEQHKRKPNPVPGTTSEEIIGRRRGLKPEGRL